jgi:uncharacterized protein YcbK (DUF882 family)
MSSYFSDQELECPCCGELEMAGDFLSILFKLRHHFDYPMPVTSGFRCQSHNAAVGGSDSSQHLEGNAVDVYWSDFSAALKYKLIQYALDYDFRGIGLSDEFIHLDLRDTVGKVWFY